ncbi:MAG: NB-ARC domain-containing protein, partial [Actinomycetota bacterium]|nr:NB-ARC domain-containing protein [Actinomycetota bacterium]
MRTLDARPHNLPVQPTPFTGRELELGEIGKLIEDRSARLVTLIGPGGIGKTRLALQAAAGSAEEFRDGVWFVPLAPVVTADRVPSAIAQAVGAREAEDGTASNAVLTEATDRQMLVVLDNMEHVVDSAPFVAQLLAAGPGVTVLATSREALHIAAERLYLVPSMEVPAAEASADSLESLAHTDAIALFLERAQARDLRFALDASNAEAVAEICRRLDGLPLAIELAAARVSSLGVDGLLERVREGLAVLGGGPEDAPERHRTLDAAIA